MAFVEVWGQFCGAGPFLPTWCGSRESTSGHQACTACTSIYLLRYLVQHVHLSTFYATSVTCSGCCWFPVFNHLSKGKNTHAVISSSFWVRLAVFVLLISTVLMLLAASLAFTSWVLSPAHVCGSQHIPGLLKWMSNMAPWGSLPPCGIGETGHSHLSSPCSAVPHAESGVLMKEISAEGSLQGATK